MRERRESKRVLKCGWLTFSIKTKLDGVRLFRLKTELWESLRELREKYIIWSVFQSNLMTNSLCCANLHCRYFPVIALWSHKWISTNLILTSGGSFAVCSASLTTQYIQKNENRCHHSVIYIIVHDRVFSKGKLFDKSRMAVKRNTGPIGKYDLHPHMGEMCGKYAGLSIKIFF